MPGLCLVGDSFRVSRQLEALHDTVFEIKDLVVAQPVEHHEDRPTETLDGRDLIGHESDAPARGTQASSNIAVSEPGQPSSRKPTIL